MRPIPQFPGYLASDDGRIWTTKRKGGNDRSAGRTGEPRELRYSVDRRGYLRVSLDMNGKVLSRRVHQLVLEAFVGPCPPGLEGCHFPDESKLNNRLSNLRWDTHAENIRDRVRGREPATLKQCRRCGDVKPMSEFYRDSRASDGLKSECKACHCAVAAETRDPEKKRAANREYMRRWRAAP